MRVKIRLLKFESNFSKLLFTHEPIGDGQVRDNRRISPAIWRRLRDSIPKSPRSVLGMEVPAREPDIRFHQRTS